MEFSLIPHQNYRFPRIAISVEAARIPEGMVVLRYVVRGAIREIRIPEPVRYASRHENLWQHTCFEAFIGVVGIDGYFEFNFSPSTGWDAYRFRAYRDRDTDLPFPSPHFDVELPPDCLEVTVALDLTDTPALADPADWHMGLSAVIEATDGTKSYWALAHAPGPPDFHNPDCFIATLPAPAAP